MSDMVTISREELLRLIVSAWHQHRTESEIKLLNRLESEHAVTDEERERTETGLMEDMKDEWNKDWGDQAVKSEQP